MNIENIFNLSLKVYVDYTGKDGIHPCEQPKVDA